ncbi:MAG: DUF1361 domain-containing protein [Bacteroidota bacterium]
MRPSIEHLKPYRSLFLLSFLAIGLLGVRILVLTPISNESLQIQLRNGNFHFLFLAWNLFLAWIPLIISHWLIQQKRARWVVATSLMGWLLFFPNAPYLLTDFVHLRNSGGVPFWYDFILLSIFGTTGLILGIYSLEQIRKYLVQYWSRSVASIMLTSTLLLSGLGIYLGRVLRWNSWDIFTNPLGLLNDTSHLLFHPIQQWQAWSLIIISSTMLSLFYGCYIKWKS